MSKASVWFLFFGLCMLGAGCAGMQPLPDQASMDAPSDPAKILVLSEYPTSGEKYLVERDGQQEIWLVKDKQGTIEFIDQASQRVKLSIKLGPCFSFANMPRQHDFGAVGKPALAYPVSSTSPKQ